MQAISLEVLRWTCKTHGILSLLLEPAVKGKAAYARGRGCNIQRAADHARMVLAQIEARRAAKPISDSDGGDGGATTEHSREKSDVSELHTHEDAVTVEVTSILSAGERQAVASGKGSRTRRSERREGVVDHTTRVSEISKYEGGHSAVDFKEIARNVSFESAANVTSGDGSRGEGGEGSQGAEWVM